MGEKEKAVEEIVNDGSHYILMHEDYFNGIMESLYSHRRWKVAVFIGGLFYYCYRRFKKINHLEKENEKLKEEKDILYFKSKEFDDEK